MLLSVVIAAKFVCCNYLYVGKISAVLFTSRGVDFSCLSNNIDDVVRQWEV